MVNASNWIKTSGWDRPPWRLRLGGMVAMVTLLAGCGIGSEERIIPASDATAEAVYERHFHGDPHEREPANGEDDPGDSDPGDTDAPVPPPAVPMIDAQGADYRGYTRTAMNELQLRFPGVANKRILLYVDPHTAGQTRTSTAIVPGYATFFWLLPEHTFALPGERHWFDSAVQ